VEGESWFVRVSSLRGEAELEKKLVDFLLDRGVSVNPLLVAGADFGFGGGEFRLDVRPFVRGDHEFTEGRLVLLVEEVRRCHEVLGEFPGLEEVRRISEERFAELGVGLRELGGALGRRAWAEIAPEEDWVRENLGFLEEMAASMVLDHPWREGAQCLHGQIHRANVLFTEGDRPVLLDFEEAVHVFAPRAWDVAHVVQRFCLFDDPEAVVLARRLEAVERVLGAVSEEITQVMREVAWFSILILVMGWRREGLRAPRGEYEKFVKFERQARELGRVLVG
jgi:Ser/Thr protein kinase RdoA (MazF antagonist)